MSPAGLVSFCSGSHFESLVERFGSLANIYNVVVFKFYLNQCFEILI